MRLVLTVSGESILRGVRLATEVGSTTITCGAMRPAAANAPATRIAAPAASPSSAATNVAKACTRDAGGLTLELIISHAPPHF